MNIVYHKDPYIVFHAGNNYIVYNQKKPFENGHTHIRNRKSAIDAVNFVSHYKIPKRTSNYYLLSLVRLSTNEKYISDILTLIETRSSKGKKQKYVRLIK